MTALFIASSDFYSSELVKEQEEGKAETPMIVFA